MAAPRNKGRYLVESPGHSCLGVLKRPANPATQLAFGTVRVVFGQEIDRLFEGRVRLPIGKLQRQGPACVQPRQSLSLVRVLGVQGVRWRRRGPQDAGQFFSAKGLHVAPMDRCNGFRGIGAQLVVLALCWPEGL